MICAYIRVSTDDQTVENQRFEIQNWCRSRSQLVEKWVSDDGVSGAKDYKKRKLGTLMRELSDGDTLIASEISRFGRDLMMVMEILRALMDKHIKVFTVKDNFVLSDEIQCKVIAFAFGLAAEIERNLIRQRTKAALDRLRAEGKRLGRPKSDKKVYYALKGKETECVEMLRAGAEKKAVCDALAVDRATLNRFLRLTGHEQYIGECKKKIDLKVDDIRGCLDKGYNLAQAARSLGVSAATVRGYADKFGLEFHKTDNKSIFDFLDKKVDEIRLKRANGMTYKAIREELSISPSCWSIWMHRAGLSEIRTIEEARKKEIEIKTLITNGLSVKQIAIALHIKQSIVKRLAYGDVPSVRVYMRDLSDSEREIARQNGISDKTLCNRLAIGWSVTDAIYTKIIPREKRHI